MSNKKKTTTTGKSKVRSLFTFVILLLAIAACAIAAYTMYEMKNMQARMLAESTTEPEAVEVTETVTPVYIPLDTFTVSLKPAGEEYDRVLYIGLTLRVNSDGDKEKIEKYLPEVRSRLLMLFSGRSADQLSHNEGKAQLINDIKQVLTTPLDDKSGVLVTDVLFNAFILR